MNDIAGESALQAYHAERAAQRRRATLLTVAVLVLAGGAWLAWREDSPPAAAALGLFAVFVAWVGRARRDADRWRRGASGEVATASVLSGLPEPPWVVLHDRGIPGSAANIDHLVIGPSGVWVLDTKTTRSLVRVGWRSVWLGSHRLDAASLRWEAGVVSERLGVRARPMIVLHGGDLRRRGVRRRGVRIVPPNGVLRRIRGARRSLAGSDVADLAALARQAFGPAAWRYGQREELRGRRPR